MLSICITLNAFAELVKKNYEYVNLRTVGVQIRHPKAILFCWVWIVTVYPDIVVSVSNLYLYPWLHIQMYPDVSTLVPNVQSLADHTGNDLDRLAHTQTWSQRKDQMMCYSVYHKWISTWSRDTSLTCTWPDCSAHLGAQLQCESSKYCKALQKTSEAPKLFHELWRHFVTFVGLHEFSWGFIGPCQVFPL
jgi:hypothetical protein